MQAIGKMIVLRAPANVGAFNMQRKGEK